MQHRRYTSTHPSGEIYSPHRFDIEREPVGEILDIHNANRVILLFWSHSYIGCLIQKITQNIKVGQTRGDMRLLHCEKE